MKTLVCQTTMPQEAWVLDDHALQGRHATVTAMSKSQSFQFCSQNIRPHEGVPWSHSKR